MKILEVQTVHIIPLKTSFEVLKEVLTEVVLEFIKEPVKNQECSNEKNNDKKKKKKKDDNDDSDDDKKYEGGIKILAVNPTKSVLIYLKLDINEFSVFKCKKKLELGVNVPMLYKLIKSIDKGDTLTMHYDDDYKQHLVITSYNSEQNSTTVDRLQIMDLNCPPLKKPSALRYDACITLPAYEFHKMCRDISNLGERVEVKCTQTNITFKCVGDCVIREKTYSTIGDNNISIMKSSDKAPLILQGVYELKDLILFNKCASLCDDVEIIMKNNQPLVLKYIIGTVGKALLCISPIVLNNEIEEEDNEYPDLSKLKISYKQ